MNGAVASLMTAKTPAEHAVLDASLVLPENLLTLGEALKKRLGAVRSRHSHDNLETVLSCSRPALACLRADPRRQAAATA